jgi:hypothetical protein
VKIAYQLFREEGLLVQRFAGLFSMEEYQRYNRKLMANPALLTITKVLNDFRDITIDDTIEDFDGHVERMAEYRKHIIKNEIKRDDVIVVFWVDKPFPTVIVQLFKEILADQNYYYCSTQQSLLEILKLPVQMQNLDTIIGNLENSF